MTSAVLQDLCSFGPTQRAAVSLPRARRYVERFTRRHHENFTVLSWLLPRSQRAAFAVIYAFCRWADDLADETGDTKRSIELLQWWQEELGRCFRGAPRHPVFVALEPVIDAHDLPRAPFDDLIEAFLWDQRIRRYDTWEELLAYCERSANPVGRLVLCLCGCREQWHWDRSDATCTALQLTNFWQDVRSDLVDRGRLYIPGSVPARYGLDLTALQDSAESQQQRCQALKQWTSDPARAAAYRATVRDLVECTWPLFQQGRELWPAVPRSMRPAVRLFTLGGEAVLRKIERANYDTLRHRPRLGRMHRLALLARGWSEGG
jgi:squalene synthase HpnC